MQRIKLNQRKFALAVLLSELAIIIAYSVIVIAGYSAYEPVGFTENDMQLCAVNGGKADGNYTDTSSEEIKAVVTPAFKLRRGIYYIQASVRGRGPVMGGLVYDNSRNGRELFDNDEFRVRPDRGVVFCRVRISEDSPVRFKVRLTGDAVEGDFVQLLQVDVTPSKITCLYRIFCLTVLFIMADLLVWGYDRYYRRWSKKQRAICMILVLTALFTGVPFFQEGVISAADLEFHMQRIEGISQGLLSGQFPVRIHPGWLDGHGYPVSVFYGDLFMYPAALLRMAGFTVEEAYKFYMLLVNGMTVAVAYYAFYKMTKDEVAAMAGSVLYAGSLYRLDHLYRAQVGTSGAMVFYPLILVGFYLLFTEDTDSREYKGLWRYLTAGFTGLLMTHMLSGLMVGIYAVVACLILIKRTIRKNTLLELLKAGTVFVLLNLWFLVPFLQYMFCEKIHINANLGKANADGTDYYALLSDFMQDGKNLYQLVAERNSVGCVLLLILMLYIVTIPFQDGEDSFVKRSRWLFGATLVSLWVCMESFPVVGLARLSDAVCRYFLTTQYQDRFMSVAVAFAASIGAIVFTMKLFSEKGKWFLMGGLLCITVWQGTMYFQDAAADTIFLDTADLNFYQGQSESYSIGNAEYLPMAVDRQLLTETVLPQEGLDVQSVDRDYLTYRITAANLTEQERNIKLPIIYYTGYRAYDRRQPAALLKTYAGENGCVTVAVPYGYSGTFTVKFHEPWYWRMAEMISLATLIAGICYKIRKGVKMHGNQKTDRPVVS